MLEKLGIILQNISTRKKLSLLSYMQQKGYSCDCYITEYFKRCDCRCDNCKFSKLKEKYEF